jgi:acylphosphatase
VAGGVVRTRVIYSGTVQGVSFRATTAGLARGRPIVGYVRNLPDGTVELEAEGPAAAVNELLAAIRMEFAGYIRDEQHVTVPATGQDRSFGIRY